MKPITIEPEFTVAKPAAYVATDQVSFIGITGNEYTPWDNSAKELIKLLEMLGEEE